MVRRTVIACLASANFLFLVLVGILFVRFQLNNCEIKLTLNYLKLQKKCKSLKLRLDSESNFNK